MAPFCFCHENNPHSKSLAHLWRKERRQRVSFLRNLGDRFLIRAWLLTDWPFNNQRYLFVLKDSPLTACPSPLYFRSMIRKKRLAGINLNFIFILFLLILFIPACSKGSSLSPSAATVDRYLKVLSSGDYDTAYYLQSERVRSQITLEDFRDVNRLSYEAYQIKSQTWKIKSWEEETGSATVSVSLTSILQDGTSLTREGKYALVKENGEWRIDAVYSAELQSP